MAGIVARGEAKPATRQVELSGQDEKKTLGAKESGSHAALPMWIDFMKVALAGKDPGTFQAAPILPPSPTALKVDTPDAAPAGDEVR